MIPQRQTIFVAEHPKGRGNCQTAVMACILELPIVEVIDTASDEVRDGGFWGPIYRWLGDRGLKMISVEPGDERLNGAYSIGVGPSPRGDFWHAVVCKNGVMVFDPHPSDDGLRELKRHDMIIPMTEVEQKLHEAREHARLTSSPATERRTLMNEAQIKHMVEQFLRWRLPDNFNPDGGISFKRMFNEHTDTPMKNEPVGTNLFDANQAEAMVRHMLDGLPQG